MGLSHNEVRGLEELFAGEDFYWGSFELAQWGHIGTIDILLLAADNPLVMGKWHDLQPRHPNPEVVYICNRNSKIEDLEILLNACFRPIRKKLLLESLEVLVARIIGDDSSRIAV